MTLQVEITEMNDSSAVLMHGLNPSVVYTYFHIVCVLL